MLFFRGLLLSNGGSLVIINLFYIYSTLFNAFFPVWEISIGEFVKKKKKKKKKIVDWLTAPELVKSWQKLE